MTKINGMPYYEANTGDDFGNTSPRVKRGRPPNNRRAPLGVLPPRNGNCIVGLPADKKPSKAKANEK